MTPNSGKDKADPDYYVSFMVPFQSVVNFLANLDDPDTVDIDESIAITDQTPMRYISATATQAGALNQDLGGIDDDNYIPDDPWNFSDPKPLVVPEPSSGILALGSLAAALFIRRRR